MDGAAAATAAAASSDDDDRDGEGEDGLEPSSTSSDDDTARVHNNPEALVVCPELKLQFSVRCTALAPCGVLRRGWRVVGWDGWYRGSSGGCSDCDKPCRGRSLVADVLCVWFPRSFGVSPCQTTLQMHWA